MIMFEDAKVSDCVESLSSRGETCYVTSESLVVAGGYAVFNPGAAESMAVSYCAPNLFIDKTAPDALYQIHVYKVSIGCVHIHTDLVCHGEVLGPVNFNELEYDSPVTGYILILASSGRGPVYVCDSVGDVHNATITTGDGLSLGGSVPEGPNNVVESDSNSTTTANDNDQLTVENYGGSHCNSVESCVSNGIRECNAPCVTGSDHCHSDVGNDAPVSADASQESCDTDYFTASYALIVKGKGPELVQSDFECRYYAGLPDTVIGCKSRLGYLSEFVLCIHVDTMGEVSSVVTECDLQAAGTMVVMFHTTGPILESCVVVGKQPADAGTVEEYVAIPVIVSACLGVKLAPGAHGMPPQCVHDESRYDSRSNDVFVITSAPGVLTPGIILEMYSLPPDTLTSGGSFNTYHPVLVRTEEHSLTSSRLSDYCEYFAVTCALGTGSASCFDSVFVEDIDHSVACHNAACQGCDAVASVSGDPPESGECAVNCPVVEHGTEVMSANFCPVIESDCEPSDSSVVEYCAAAISEDGTPDGGRGECAVRHSVRMFACMCIPGTVKGPFDCHDFNESSVQNGTMAENTVVEVARSSNEQKILVREVFSWRPPPLWREK